MGLKDSVKNLVEKARDKYDDYLERKQLELEKRAEIQRLNTPIMSVESVYDHEQYRVYGLDSSYKDYEDCYESKNVIMQAGVYPEKFQIGLYERIELRGDLMGENEYGLPEVDKSNTLIETKPGEHIYHTFSKYGNKLLTNDEAEKVLFAVEKLEEKYYITDIISCLEPYFVFSEKVTKFLDGCLSDYLQDKYSEYKSSMSHEQAKNKAINLVKPYKEILNRKSKEYADKYQIYLNKQREQETKKQNEKNDLLDSYRSL